MRTLLAFVLGGLLLSATTGCLIPLYASDPNRRTQEMIFTSEGLRMINDEWERVWMLDQPDHMTPYRTHGGIISTSV